MNEVPIKGIKAKTAITAPHKTGFLKPNITNPNPPKIPCRIPIIKYPKIIALRSFLRSSKISSLWLFSKGKASFTLLTSLDPSLNV